MILFFFGILIELFQEYSNNISIKLLGRRIHGNFDVEDVLFNFIGILWGYIVILSFNIIKKSR
jgi:glycopeptide antibiotics resistance protein